MGAVVRSRNLVVMPTASMAGSLTSSRMRSGSWATARASIAARVLTCKLRKPLVASADTRNRRIWGSSSMTSTRGCTAAGPAIHGDEARNSMGPWPTVYSAASSKGGKIGASAGRGLPIVNTRVCFYIFIIGNRAVFICTLCRRAYTRVAGPSHVRRLQWTPNRSGT